MKKLLIGVVLFALLTSCASPMPNISGDAKIPDPDAAFFFIRGYEAELAHNWQEAESHYRKALSIDPVSRYIRIQLGYVLNRMEKTDEVLVLMNSLLREEPDDVHALRLKAEILRQQKKYHDAVGVLERLSKLQPDNKDNLLMLGMLHYYLDQHDRAIDVLGELLSKDPSAYKVFDLLGSIYIDKKDYDTAAEYLRMAIKFNPDTDTAYFKLGIIAEFPD